MTKLKNKENAEYEYKSEKSGRLDIHWMTSSVSFYWTRFFSLVVIQFLGRQKKEKIEKSTWFHRFCEIDFEFA